jgi:hypothetical protein
MAERTGDYQEEVLSDLLDLQADLRGEAREQPIVSVAGVLDAEPDAAPPAEAAPHADGDVVTVATSDLEVSVAPSTATESARLVALTERLSKLEASLAGMVERIDGVDAKAAAEPEADAPWRSFLDLQKMVADRLDRR